MSGARPNRHSALSLGETPPTVHAMEDETPRGTPLERQTLLKYGASMKIAQVAPLAESVPPKLYGGTERVVAYLADELVRQGHDVTLFASGDSRTCATLVPVCDRA